MDKHALIKTADELEFAIFCIENVATALHTDGQTVYRALNESNILTDYIVPSYDVLHTQGKGYIVNDIIDVIKERNVVL
ncbi:MAG: DUF3791 domain-containing protein [Clostridia bacterium]|nr:DUF3791 domain-containing protein [Clostridia bacterium]